MINLQSLNPQIQNKILKALQIRGECMKHKIWSLDSQDTYELTEAQHNGLLKLKGKI